MPLGLLSGCALGAALGARHAFEPDHLAAVSTLIAERPRPRHAAALGALWGIGHAAMLLVVGGALLLVRGELPPGAIAVLEGVVAAMLIVLGIRSLRMLHVHTGGWHAHAARRPGTIRPLAIGLIHGLAGSGGLAALALAEMPTIAGALGYILTFALGSILGMTALSGLAGASLGRIAAGPRARTIVVGVAGALSVFVGLLWAATIAVTSGG